MRNRSHRAAVSLRRIWGELEHSQRRLFEIRTGVSATRPTRPRDEHQIAMLEDLYRRGWRH
ncbi:MAG TPA: hypothetical protein VF781_07045 [Solirubrobacteraceae bacterium]